MIDTHCHLTYDGLYERVDEVIAAAQAAGVDRMITVGTTPRDAQRAMDLAERYDGVYATVGVHPHYAADWLDAKQVNEALRIGATHPRIVALGEMGLDRHYPDPPIELQKQLLAIQLDAASQVDDLPIVIHNREATEETLAMLRASGIAPERFVFHCFTGEIEELDSILAFGAMVSFTGIVTFRNAPHLAEGAKRVPLARLMVETDSPYLTPAPHRKVRPNEPRYVVDVARFLAEVKEMAFDEFTDAMDTNAERFFGRVWPQTGARCE